MTQFPQYEIGLLTRINIAFILHAPSFLAGEGHPVVVFVALLALSCSCFYQVSQFSDDICK